MITLAATSATLAELVKAREAAENELRKMRRINHAFAKGRAEFLRRGFPPADYQKFSDTIDRNPEYGSVPFSPRLIFAKLAQIDRLDREILIGKRLLTLAKAG